MICIRSLLFAVVLLTQFQVCRAALVITLTPSSGTYFVGDVGTIDVMVHSNNAPNDLLDSYLFSLNVTGGAGVTFVAPQSEAYLTDPNYVFSGRSANIAFGLPATSLSNAGATLTAADVSYDFTPATLGNPLPRVIPSAATPLLLGRFAFTAGLIGDYSIAFDPSSSFSDVNFNTFSYPTPTPASFSVTAVPEPSSLALLAVTVSAVLGVRAWRRRSSSMT
jgi:hypothetical protein